MFEILAGLVVFGGLFVYGAVSFWQLYKAKEAPNSRGLTQRVADNPKTTGAVIGLPISFFILLSVTLDKLGKSGLIITQISIIGMVVAMVALNYILKRNARS